MVPLKTTLAEVSMNGITAAVVLTVSHLTTAFHIDYCGFDTHVDTAFMIRISS